METIKCNKCGSEKIKVKYCANCKTAIHIKSNIDAYAPGICNKCNEKRIFAYFCPECKTVNKTHKESKEKVMEEKNKTGLSFVGKICPYCKTEFKEGDDVVVCSICEMPHHKECWIENKACTTFGCTGTIVGSEAYAETVNNKTFCSKCGAPLCEGQKFCASCGTPAGTTGEPHFQVAGTYSTNQSYQQNTYTAPQPQYTPQYSAPQYIAGYNPYGQQQQQVDQDLYTFIQSNQLFYIAKFQQMQISNTKTSWNWCSFLFSAYWLHRCICLYS